MKKYRTTVVEVAKVSGGDAYRIERHVCPANTDISRVMRKPAFCKSENKGADQLRSYCAADQRLCFHCIDSTIPLLSKVESSSF